MAKIDITEFNGMNLILDSDIVGMSYSDYILDSDLSNASLSVDVDYIISNGVYVTVDSLYPVVKKIYIRYESVSESSDIKYRFNYGVVNDVYARSFYVNPNDGYIHYDSFVFDGYAIDNRINPITPFEIINNEVTTNTAITTGIEANGEIKNRAYVYTYIYGNDTYGFMMESPPSKPSVAREILPHEQMELSNIGQYRFEATLPVDIKDPQFNVLSLDRFAKLTNDLDFLTDDLGHNYMYLDTNTDGSLELYFLTHETYEFSSIGTVTLAPSESTSGFIPLFIGLTTDGNYARYANLNTTPPKVYTVPTDGSTSVFTYEDTMADNIPSNYIRYYFNIGGASNVNAVAFLDPDAGAYLDYKIFGQTYYGNIGSVTKASYTYSTHSDHFLEIESHPYNDLYQYASFCYDINNNTLLVCGLIYGTRRKPEAGIYHTLTPTGGISTSSYVTGLPTDTRNIAFYPHFDRTVSTYYGFSGIGSNNKWIHILSDGTFLKSYTLPEMSGVDTSYMINIVAGYNKIAYTTSGIFVYTAGSYVDYYSENIKSTVRQVSCGYAVFSVDDGTNDTYSIAATCGGGTIDSNEPIMYDDGTYSNNVLSSSFAPSTMYIYSEILKCWTYNQTYGEKYFTGYYTNAYPNVLQTSNIINGSEAGVFYEIGGCHKGSGGTWIPSSQIKIHTVEPTKTGTKTVDRYNYAPTTEDIGVFGSHLLYSQTFDEVVGDPTLLSRETIFYLYGGVDRPPASDLDIQNEVISNKIMKITIRENVLASSQYTQPQATFTPSVQLETSTLPVGIYGSHIFSNDDRYYLVGGKTSSGLYNQILESTDGVTWSVSSKTLPYEVYGGAYATSERYFIIYGGYIYNSTYSKFVPSKKMYYAVKEDPYTWFEVIEELPESIGLNPFFIDIGSSSLNIPNSISLMANCDTDKFNISGYMYPSDVPQGVNKMRLYTTLNGEWRYLDEIDINQKTYIDTKSDTLLGEVLNTYEVPPSLDGIIQTDSGMCVGWSGKDIHFTEPFQPWSWNTDWSLKVEDNIVRCVFLYGYIYVLTEGQPYVLKGEHPSIISISKLLIQNACIGEDAVDINGDALYYCSNSGIIRVIEESGENITENYIGKEVWSNYLTTTPKLLADGDSIYVEGISDSLKLTLLDNEIKNIIYVSKLSYTPTGSDTVVQGIKYNYITGTGVDTDAEYIWRSNPTDFKTNTNMTSMQVMSDGDNFVADIKIITEHETYPSSGWWSVDKLSGEYFKIPRMKPSKSWQIEIKSKNTINRVQLASSMKEIGDRNDSNKNK